MSDTVSGLPRRGRNSSDTLGLRHPACPGRFPCLQHDSTPHHDLICADEADVLTLQSSHSSQQAHVNSLLFTRSFIAFVHSPIHPSLPPSLHPSSQPAISIHPPILPSSIHPSSQPPTPPTHPPCLHPSLPPCIQPAKLVASQAASKQDSPSAQSSLPQRDPHPCFTTVTCQDRRPRPL